MSTPTDPTAFGYGDFNFSWGDHICAFFDDHAQQMEIMIPFMGQGLRAGQRCVWVGPEPSCRRLREFLTKAGGDLPTLEVSGQLVILSEVEFYLRDGVFEPQRTLELGWRLLQDGQAQGYDTMRIATDLPWEAPTSIDPEVWEIYEEQVTRALAGAPVVAICQYQRKRVPSAVVFAALHTHPFVILGGAIYENPFAGASPSASASPLM